MTMLITIPAKAGTHFGVGSPVEEWVPAFAGMVMWSWVGE